jgi:phospholipid/cholesterol/gamma-HCH transport system permease protein
LALEARLTATTLGELIELRPGGSWTAVNGTVLESLTASVMPAVDGSKSIKLDLAGLSELDTLGAWLIEKLLRRAASAGHRAEVTGVAEHYAGLIDEVRQVNRRPVALPSARNPILARLD